MTAIAFGFAFLGCILLSMSLKRHYHQVWPASLEYSRWVALNRYLGYTLLFISLVPCVLFRGLWIGMVLWVSLLAIAAFIQAMALTYLPRQSPWLGGAGILLVLAGMLA